MRSKLATLSAELRTHWVGLRRREPARRLIARALGAWIGFMFFWAFLALWFQMPGLNGPTGILPAADFLRAVAQSVSGWARLAVAPSLLWLGSSNLAIHVLCATGLVASVLVIVRWHPRWAIAVCLVCFLSFLAVAQAFASYQSDGMLMSAGLICLFLDDAAPGWWSLFSLRWLWFTIYFGSGVAKIASGDPEWRHLTAMDLYYENGPLPTWIGWYAQQHLSHRVEAAIALSTLVVELGLVWLAFLPRRCRIICFWIVTPMQVGIILTANYGFLNYLVLGLGLALLDDQHLRFLWRLVPWRHAAPAPVAPVTLSSRRTAWTSGVLCIWVTITGANLAHRAWSTFPDPQRLSDALAPFRLTDPFGLFAVMTRERYEIEFQGTLDGQTWTPYPYRYKPQDPAAAPGIYAPYQPRFDWNLWFASLGNYRDDPWVEQVELRLLSNDPSVVALFAGNPFVNHPPKAVRAVIWQYWFSTPQQKAQLHVWWTRRLLGLYAPILVMTPEGAQVLPQP